MKIVIFGLAVSSSWGNGHAALWRGLIRGLLADGHAVEFFERDVPFYAENRDLVELPEGGRLVLYADWAGALPAARRALAGADVALVTSYCPDALAATALIRDDGRAMCCFYDLDTPVTLARLDAGEPVDYLGPEGLAPYDLVLSYTGGGALDALRDRLGARRVVPIYGSVDPALHHPVSAPSEPRALLSYMGTYAADRQAALEALFIEPARLRRADRFVIGGSQYPQHFPWTDNIWFVRHLPPDRHPAFYCSSRITLNVTRAAMARMGHCPSGRLFEAAACGTPILTDSWDGLDQFFTPGEEILVARDTKDAMAALALPDAELGVIARRARERTLAEHSAARRARQMVDAFEQARAGVPG
jgi:spore maturation protein CgeB